MKRLLILLFWACLLVPAFGQTNNFKWVLQSTYTAGGTDTYTASIPGLTAYGVGLEVKILFTNSNTASSTLQIGSLAVITLKKNGSTNLAPGDIPPGATLVLSYDGTNFQVLGLGGSGAVTSVTGTTNRITSTGGLTPVIDISGSYVGQTSITTLGTIGTGTWNGSVIGSSYGGAGAISGLLKANGSGVVSAAVADTDYLTPSGSGSGLSGVWKTAGTSTLTAAATIAQAGFDINFTGGALSIDRSAAGGYLLQIPLNQSGTAPNGISTVGKFRHTLYDGPSAYLNSDGQIDAVYQFGYNHTGSGGRVNTNEASFHTAFESHYIGGGTSATGDFEYHLESNARNGNINRHFSMNIQKATGESLAFWQLGRGMDWRVNNALTSYMSISGKGDFRIAGEEASLWITNTTNDAGIKFQTISGFNTFLNSTSSQASATLINTVNNQFTGAGKITDMYGVKFGLPATLTYGSQYVSADAGSGDFIFNNGSGGGFNFKWRQSGADIMTLNGTGDLSLKNLLASGSMVMTGSASTFTLGGGATASELRFLEPSGGGSEYSSFKAVAQGSNITYSLPPTVGGAGTVLTDAVGDGVLTWASPAGSGDMILANVQTVTGAKTFNDTKLLLRNVANTFNGSFVNTNTADRIYTLKDAAGTIAFTSDITGTNSGTNSGDQTITNSSDATSHTVTLSSSGGTTQLIEGANITLTTGGTGSAGTVTIASSGGGITNSAANTELMMSNGTNAVPSGHFAASTGRMSSTYAGGTNTETQGYYIANTTSASSGQQAISPQLVLAGNGWKSTATAFSRIVLFAQDVLPVEGGSNPTALWRLRSNIAGAGLQTALTFDTNGGAGIFTSYGTISLGTSNGGITFLDGGSGQHITFGTTNGSQIGTSTSQKFAFYGATPVVRQSAVTTSQGIADVLTAYGLLPSSTISSLTYAQSKALSYKFR